MSAYATTVPVWAALTVYPTGARVQPTALDNRVFQATVGGTSGAAEPVWATIAPWTNTDGTVTWSKASSARRQFVQGIYTTLKAFQTANPTMLLDVSKTRPSSIVKLALPAAYIGSRDESIAIGQGVQTRTFTGLQVVLVDIVPDNDQAQARADDLIDALVDWFASNYHAASGFSILALSSVTETREDDGATTYLANILTFGPSFVTEGRT